MVRRVLSGPWHQLEMLLPSAERSAAGPSSRRGPVPQFVRNPKARRYLLRVTRTGEIRVTIPRGGNEVFARQFVLEKAEWIREQLERVAANPVRSHPWGPGTLIWYRGARTPLEEVAGGLRLGDLRIDRPATGGDWRRPVEAALRVLASEELPPLVIALALRHQLPARRVTVRGQRTRWGSCSRNGTISLNWRLVQTPVLVRDYLVAHELAHLLHMNHSRRFWGAVEHLFPVWREAEAWLKRHGREVIADGH